MATKLYVGNLSFGTTEGDLRNLFSSCGTVTSCTLIMDKFTGKSRGFAFVTMSSPEEAQKAISLFHGKTVGGRPLTVYEHRPPMMEVVCLRDLTELFQFDDPPSTPFGSRERQRSLP